MKRGTRISEFDCPACNQKLRYWNNPRRSKGGSNHSFYAAEQFFICPTGLSDNPDDWHENRDEFEPKRLYKEHELADINRKRGGQA